MSKVLLIHGMLSLEMRDGETQEEAVARFFDELDKTDFEYCVFDKEEVVEE